MIHSLIIIFSIIILWTLTYIQDWKSVFSFILCLVFSYYFLNYDEYVSFAMSAIVACIIHLNTNIENFKIETEKNTNDDDDDDNDNHDEDDEDDEDEDDDDDEIDTKDEDDINIEKDETDESYFNNSNKNPIDMTETIKSALNNFDPKTLEAMTNDTTKLIKSQSELMKVIEQMQPVISKGMALVDKFQGKGGKTEQLFKQFHAITKK